MTLIDERRQVGTLSLAFAGKGTPAMVGYTVDGVQVTKSIVPFSWRMSDIAYGYGGVMRMPGHGSSDAGDAIGMTVTITGSAFRIGSFLERTRTTCDHTGTASAWNMAVHFTGSYTCSDGSSARTLPIIFLNDCTGNAE